MLVNEVKWNHIPLWWHLYKEVSFILHYFEVLVKNYVKPKSNTNEKNTTDVAGSWCAWMKFFGITQKYSKSFRISRKRENAVGEQTENDKFE